MNSKPTRTAFLLTLLSSVLLLTSCDKNETTDNPAPTATGYSIYGVSDNGQYLLQAPGVQSGSVTFVKNGAEVTNVSGIAGYNLIYKNGFYYLLDGSSGRFSKYKLENNTFTVVTQIPLTLGGGYVTGAQWTDDKTLVLTSDNATATGAVIATVNVQTMTASAVQALPIPAPQNPTTNIFTAGFTLRSGKLQLYYGHYPNGTAVDDTARIATMDYPALTNVVIAKDIRTTGLSGSFFSTPVAITTENGDVYALGSASGDFAGNNPKKPAGILRVKSGQTAIDPAYFFNTGAATGGACQQGLWYLGNGKAITKSWSGTYYNATNAYNWEYYVVDLTAQTLTKLNVPKSDGLNFRNEVIVENGKAYLTVNSEKDGNSIYAYDIASGQLTKGLKVEGVQYIEAFFKEK